MRHVVLFVICLLLALLEPVSADARAVLDRADPAFNGSVTVALPPPGLGPNDTVFEFQSGGVTFRFESTSGLRLDQGDGGITVPPGGNVGVLVTVNPPVSAIGFVGELLVDSAGQPGGTFVGTTGSDVVAADGFFGAADIGAIGTVNLSRPPAAFVVTEMVFVACAACVPPGDADLAIQKTTPTAAVGHSQALHHDLQVDNLGPDTAQDVRVIDFLDPALAFTGAPGGVFDPTAHIVTWMLGDQAAASTQLLTLDTTTTADRFAFTCTSRIVNIAVVASPTPGLDLSNNVSTATTSFDRSSVAGAPEICDNGIDDNCDGRTDCLDPQCGSFPACQVVPGSAGSGGLRCGGSLTPLPELERIFEGVGCEALDVAGLANDASGRSCQASVVNTRTGQTRDITLRSFCCEPPPPNGTETIRRAQCQDSFNRQLGADERPGAGIPLDPNFKTSVPTVNFLGFGFTEAGRTMTYTLHYENVGTADAHDVSIIDVLHPGLDETTLLVSDGGTYDPASRTLLWRDPVVPPATPRSVAFSVAVHTDAVPGSRVVNVGTIVFPDAVPPSRIDTNVVEHVVTNPGQIIAPDLRVARCQETAPGSGRWQAALVNEGFGYAFNVTATILGAPASVQVTDAVATGFFHPDDPPGSVATVVPLAVTLGSDPVDFTTQTAGDPCDTILWRLQWQDASGASFTRDVRSASDADGDGVADTRDNCPATFNPTQTDTNGNGVGDACEQVVCDVDGNGRVDRSDIDVIFAARNTPAGPGDPRDVNSQRGDGVPDGMITVDDARFCTLRCTKPRCAP